MKYFSPHRRTCLITAILAACAASGPLLAQSSASPSFKWVAGDLPPFVWTNSNGPQGLAYELAVAMAQRMGRESDVSFYPWARAMRMVTEGQNVGIFPLARTPEREASFHWLAPLMRVKYVFFFRNGDERAERPVEQLRANRIGVLRGSLSAQSLQANRFIHIVETKDYRDLLRMLNEGMVHAIYAGAPMMRAAIMQHGFSTEDYRIGATLDEAELYMGASLAVPAAEVERWRAAYRELQQDGTVARLQKKYLGDR